MGPGKKMTFLVGQTSISSNVWECLDRETEELVVIKVIHDTAPYNIIGLTELRFYEFFGKIAESETHFPRMHDHFEHCNHRCLVFEKLGPRMRDVLIANYCIPLPLSLVRDVGRQLLESVELFHRFRFIHTDLRPENILFVSLESVKTPVSKTAPGLKNPEFSYLLPASNTIKVLDFGNVVTGENASNYLITSFPYRAPEVVLGLGWSFPCDIWSVGCILLELCLGRPILNVPEDLERLAWMEAYLGQFPSQMLKRVKHKDAEKYVKKGMLNWPAGATSAESVERISKTPRLQDLLRRLCDSEDFIRLVHDLLTLDPSGRPTAAEALKHPFFTRD
ncbi:dual-specificity kinase [Ranunculus cassubicifolius]